MFYTEKYFCDGKLQFSPGFQKDLMSHTKLLCKTSNDCCKPQAGILSWRNCTINGSCHDIPRDFHILEAIPWKVRDIFNAWFTRFKVFSFNMLSFSRNYLLAFTVAVSYIINKGFSVFLLTMSENKQG